MRTIGRIERCRRRLNSKSARKKLVASKIELSVLGRNFARAISQKNDCLNQLKDTSPYPDWSALARALKGWCGCPRLHKFDATLKKTFCFVKVDEEGAEAAAATVDLLCMRGSYARPPESVPLIVDHPFLFFILSGTGVPVFAGHVTHPKFLKWCLLKSPYEFISRRHTCLLYWTMLTLYHFMN